MQEPESCNCNMQQDLLIGKSVDVSIIDYKKSKCKFDDIIFVDMQPDNILTQFTISLWSGDRLLIKQIMVGKSTLRVEQEAILKRKKLWMRIEASDDGDHIASIRIN